MEETRQSGTDEMLLIYRPNQRGYMKHIKALWIKKDLCLFF